MKGKQSGLDPSTMYYQSQSNTIDGHTNNILYQTIKQIVAKAKSERKIEAAKQIQISWEQFREFTPM